MNIYTISILLFILFLIIVFLALQYFSLQEKYHQLQTTNATLEVKIEEQNRYNQEKSLLLESHKAELKEEFEKVANRVLQNNAQTFTSLSTQNLDKLINPLHQQLYEFKQQVADVYTKESQERAVLQHEIGTLKTLNQQISQDAINLTKALKGENKKQGIWGEMVLTRILENSGLREGSEFQREVTCYTEENKSFRPDVIVKLPNEKDIIIDAKTSLIAYERYINTQDSKAKAEHLKAHIDSIKKHINSLSEKNYENLKGLNTLDFIFMFMPIEGALATALEHNTTLYDYALNQKIILVSPTTLLVAMRTIENIWRQEKQNKNAKDIAKRAGAMYDKFVGFSEDMVKISKQLDTVQQSFLSAKTKLSHGRGNLVDQAQNLKELGAQSSKKLSKQL